MRDRGNGRHPGGSIVPYKQPQPVTDPVIATRFLLDNAFTQRQEQESRYKMVIESLSEEEISALITAWMGDLNHGIAVPHMLRPNCWPEKEEFDLPEYLSREGLF